MIRFPLCFLFRDKQHINSQKESPPYDGCLPNELKTVGRHKDGPGTVFLVPGLFAARRISAFWQTKMHL